MDAALRIFLIVSGDSGGPRVEFFWPPIHTDTAKGTTSGAMPPRIPASTSDPSHSTERPSRTETQTNDVMSFEEFSLRHTSSVSSLLPSSATPKSIPPLAASSVPAKAKQTKLSKPSKLSKSVSLSSIPRNVSAEWTFNTLEHSTCVYGLPLADLGEILFPPHRYHHKIFELKIDDILYISYPFCWPAIQRRTKKLIGFNIVFAIDLQMEFNKYTKQNKKMWFDIIIKYVRIVQHEERRIGYLSSQLLRMREITDSVLSEANQLRKDRKDQKKKELKEAEIVSNVLTAICSECPIANDMKGIQQILSVNDEIKLLINGWVELHCSLKPPEHETAVIRPYHTLLIHHNAISHNNNIRKDAHDLLQQIPISGSQSLRLMISTANICSSFGDMASLTNIPLPTLFHFALHLKYWGKAQIIETINKSAEFAINPNANFGSIRSLYERQFAVAFPHRKSLIEELERFNHPKALEKHLVHLRDQQQQDFIFLIAWLLQRKLLIRFQKYIKFLPHSNSNRRKDKEKLNNIFEKVKPYFDGQNHFLEVLFQTGLSSKKLQLVMDEFKEQLIFCSY